MRSSKRSAERRTYSTRNATTGSTRTARRAGSQHAASAISTIATAAAKKLTGSTGRYFEEQAFEKARQRERAAGAGGNARQREDGGAGDDEPEHVRPTAARGGHAGGRP